jgi:hypothetical protein
MSNVTQVRPVEADMRDACRRVDGKMDRQTEGQNMIKLTGAFRDSANLPIRYVY